MAQWRKWTYKREDEFLRWLKEGHTVTYACDKLSIPSSTAYKHRSEDPQFAAKWKEAREAGADKLEEVAIDRAIKGSDRLLEFLLKGAKPEKYRERIETSGEQNLNVRFTYDSIDAGAGSHRHLSETAPAPALADPEHSET